MCTCLKRINGPFCACVSLILHHWLIMSHTAQKHLHISNIRSAFCSGTPKKCQKSETGRYSDMRVIKESLINSPKEFQHFFLLKYWINNVTCSDFSNICLISTDVLHKKKLFVSKWRANNAITVIFTFHALISRKCLRNLRH